jgi:lauroyl/myristoyl acyltransferase
VRPLVALSLASVPGWRRRVSDGMRAALGPEAYRPQHARAYFARLADLVAFATVVYRTGIRDAGLEREVELDPAALEMYREALSGGKGALMVCPHLVGHEVMAGLAAAELPLTVLVRKSPDPGYEAIKQRWYASLGVEVAYRPPKGEAGEGLAEMASALRALRKGRVLALTPDLLQRPGKGIPVQLFGRTAHLPAGAFFLAVRMEAPLLPSFVHHEKGRYRLWSHPPLAIDRTLDRDAAIARAAQEWATLFEAFVREHPEMWQFWLDKRWSQWLVEGSGFRVRGSDNGR